MKKKTLFILRLAIVLSLFIASQSFADDRAEVEQKMGVEQMKTHQVTLDNKVRQEVAQQGREMRAIDANMREQSTYEFRMTALNLTLDALRLDGPGAVKDISGFMVGEYYRGVQAESMKAQIQDAHNPWSHYETQSVDEPSTPADIQGKQIQGALTEARIDRYQSIVETGLNLIVDVATKDHEGISNDLKKLATDEVTRIYETNQKISDIKNSGNNANSASDSSCGGGGDYFFLQSRGPGLTSYINADGNIKKSTEALVAKITLPADGFLVRGDVPIFGLAYGKNFKEYLLEYGKGRQPSEWHTIYTSAAPRKKDISGEELEYLPKRPFGNLATWDTGLKNFFTWNHPPDHPVNLNGVYTLRLRAIGKDGQMAEDTKTVEVGNVITMAYGGAAASADNNAALNVPEHALISNYFRIFAIKPLEGAALPAPSGYTARQNIYEFKPSGELFAKPALLEISYEGSSEKAPGIYAYNYKTKSWEYLPSEVDVKRKKATVRLIGFYKTRAYFTLFERKNGTESLRPYPLAVKRISVDDGGSRGEWGENSFFIGASVSVDKSDYPDRKGCLKFTNKVSGGSFSAAVRRTPFDARQYPVIQFDYLVPAGVKTNFLAKAGGKWYEIGFTGGIKRYPYKYANIINIGKIDNVSADGKWHTVRFDLYKMLRTKTRNTFVEEMIMADFNIRENFQLTYGSNARGAMYYIDNFKISKIPPEDSGAEIKIDLTDAKPFAFWGYSGWVYFFKKPDLSEFQGLSFKIGGGAGNEKLYIQLEDGNGNESEIALERYLPREVSNDRQEVTIPLSAFFDIQNWNNMRSFSVYFKNGAGINKGSACIEDIRLERYLKSVIAHDFNPAEKKNPLGGDSFSFSSSISRIKADYGKDYGGGRSPNGCRIAFAGNIGSPHVRCASFCAWSTELKGLDARQMSTISLYIKGAAGGEKPNLYLKDGMTNSICVHLEKYADITPSWQKVEIPLKDFEANGLDLSRLEELSLIFQEKTPPGAVFIDTVSIQ